VVVCAVARLRPHAVRARLSDSTDDLPFGNAPIGWTAPVWLCHRARGLCTAANPVEIVGTRDVLGPFTLLLCRHEVTWRAPRDDVTTAMAAIRMDSRWRTSRTFASSRRFVRFSHLRMRSQRTLGRGVAGIKDRSQRRLDSADEAKFNARALAHLHLPLLAPRGLGNGRAICWRSDGGPPMANLFA